MPCNRCSNRRDKIKRTASNAVTYLRDRMTQPQQRRRHRKIITDATKAIRSRDTTAQNVARRGYALKPGTEHHYKRAINQLGKQGVPLAERWAILRGDYGVG